MDTNKHSHLALNYGAAAVNRYVLGVCMRALLILAMCFSTQCWSQDISENTSKNLYEDGWKCNEGFYKSGNQCQKVKTPQNASLDAYGSGWKCNEGFYKSGNQCRKVKTPQNAS